MKAFVAGATGQTGRRIVEELVKRNIPVRALVRNLETAREILPPQAELVTGDVLNAACLAEAIGDCTVLLCATGATPSFDPMGPYKVDYDRAVNLGKIPPTKNPFVVTKSETNSNQIYAPKQDENGVWREWWEFEDATDDEYLKDTRYYSLTERDIIIKAFKVRRRGRVS